MTNCIPCRHTRGLRKLCGHRSTPLIGNGGTSSERRLNGRVCLVWIAQLPAAAPAFIYPHETLKNSDMVRPAVFPCASAQPALDHDSLGAVEWPAEASFSAPLLSTSFHNQILITIVAVAFCALGKTRRQ